MDNAVLAAGQFDAEGFQKAIQGLGLQINWARVTCFYIDIATHLQVLDEGLGVEARGNAQWRCGPDHDAIELTQPAEARCRRHQMEELHIMSVIL
jgi:hypothetical protein